MVDFQSPGTKVTTRRKGALSRISVNTAIGGFQCVTERGPIFTPTLVTNPGDFEELFGARVEAYPQGYDDMLAFFTNGGKSCYINRVAANDAAAAYRRVSTLGPAGYGSETSAVGPFVLTAGHTVIVSVDGGGADTATIAATPATFTLTGGSFAGGGAGDVMTLTINGVPGTQTIDLTATAATQQAYTDAINAQIVGAKAAISAGNIVVTTDQRGSGAGGTILTLGGALNVRLHTGALGAFTNAGPNNVVDVRAVTAAEMTTILSAAISGATTTDNGDGSFTIQTDTVGIAGTIQVDSSSTADTALGLDNSVHTGTAATSVLATNIAVSSSGAFGNLMSSKVTRNDTNVTTVAATIAGSTATIVVASSSRLQIGDQISITKGGDVQRGVISSINGTTVGLVAAITVPGGGYAGTEVVVLETWTLTVYDKNGLIVAPSPFRDLRCSPLAGPRYYEVVVNDTSRTPITLTDLSPAASDPRPANETTAVVFANGADGTAPVVLDYTGSMSARTGVYAWDKAPDVNFVSISGIADILGGAHGAAVLKGLETYLELRQDVQGVISGPSGKNHTDIKDWVQVTANFYSRFLSIIWPHIYLIDATLGVKRLKSPTGAWQGVMARTHTAVNFAAAPAGVENGVISGCLGLEYSVAEGSSEYDYIFPAGINAIINFPGEGYVVFGDSTLDSTKEFDNHGEMTGFCIASREARKLTRFVNFRANNEDTQTLVVGVLTTLFRDWLRKGVLKGTKDEEGFYVICDETNNTPSVVAQNKIITRIGLAFEEPARFHEITLERDTRAVEAALAG
jgi:hypothetical protein